ncbi:MAG: iron ABC transporter permease [Ruminococcus sp.]|nr:iron ABC transporter permease [Ruminococcus sp.]
MNKRIKRAAVSYIFLAVLLIAAVVLNLCLGSTDISVNELISALKDHDSSPVTYRILTQIRLPRTAAALILGGGLAVSGLLLQSFFSNPVAGPYILGISSGAKLAVALIMVYSLAKGILLSSAAMVGAAFVGALASMFIVLAISAKVKRMSILIVCGVMIGYICSAITEFIVNLSDDSNIVNLHNWSMGSFSGISPDEAVAAAFIIIPAVVCAFFLSKPMDAYRLGESYAVSSGVNVSLFRAALILLSSLLSACVTAFAGPVSFVGIAVPHGVKSLFGTSKPIVILPACFLGGAVFCLFCDLITRTVFAPTELSISTVTAVFGASVVIWMLTGRERRMDNE